MLTAERILNMPGLARFMEYFSIRENPISDPEGFLQAIALLNACDKGKWPVQFQLESNQDEWPRETQREIMNLADMLDLLDVQTELLGQYDLIIVLNQNPAVSIPERLQFVINGMIWSNVSTKKIVLACSSRLLSEAEIESVSRFAPGAVTEANLCYAAINSVREKYRSKISVVVHEDDKAGNPEVIAKALQDSGARPGERVVVVTSQIHCTAARLELGRVAIPFGITNIDGAGNADDSAFFTNIPIEKYLSEVLWTLRAAVLQCQASNR